MIADDLWEACVEPGIDLATREARSVTYINHVLDLDRDRDLIGVES